MSNASLKEQLQAMAAQLSTEPRAERKSKPPRQSSPRTKVNAADKNKPKPKWLEQMLYGVELLKAYFPQCFKSAKDVQPLKIGIKQDLVKHLSTIDSIVSEDKACMVKTLAYYVNTSAYHKSVKEGSTRIDLNGNPAGIVTGEEAKYSLQRHQSKLQARKSAASDSSTVTQTNVKEEITQ